MADDGRRVHIPEPPCLARKRNEASPASSRQGQEIRVRDRRHSPAVRVQHTHSKPHQEKREDRQSHYADREVRYGQQGKKHHARRGGNPMASLTARPFGRLREGTRNPESARLRHRYAGEFQRVNRKSQEQEDVQRLRNRGGCAEKRDGTKLHG